MITTRTPLAASAFAVVAPRPAEDAVTRATEALERGIFQYEKKDSLSELRIVRSRDKIHLLSYAYNGEELVKKDAATSESRSGEWGPTADANILLEKWGFGRRGNTARGNIHT